MRLLLSFLALLCAGTLMLTSCATTGSSSTKQMLSASGFRSKAPETQKQRAIFAQLPSYKVQRGTHDGKVFYAYKDEKEGVALIGSEKEYQRYQQLAVQRRIAQDQVLAAQMNRDLAYGWYGAYRPHYRGFYY